ncbi:cartilage intermediate layer protein 1-like [Glandiceps talaboti]
MDNHPAVEMARIPHSYAVTKSNDNIRKKAGKRLHIIIVIVIATAIVTAVGILVYLYNQEPSRSMLDDAASTPWSHASTTGTAGEIPSTKQTTTVHQEPPSYIQDTTSWVTWGQWSVCDSSCGGGQQIRRRTCFSQDPDKTCKGNPIHSRSCADWPCPECSQSCEHGVLFECLFCSCENDTIEGVVTDHGGRVLHNVTVHRYGFPREPLATTNQNGFFSIHGVCIRDSTLQIAKDGFLMKRIDLSSQGETTASVLEIAIELEKEAVPVIDIHPQDKVRKVKESVTFCCHGHGKPNPNYYEWFKNGEIIEEYSFGLITNLTITNLTLLDAGNYQCRVNNKIGSQYSSVAQLKVSDNDEDVCSPLPHYIKLPSECSTGNGSARYDVRKCSRYKCPGNLANDYNQCTDDRQFCCMETSKELRHISCASFNISILVVNSCECTPCRIFTRRVTGHAVAADNGEPLRSADLIIDGGTSITTSYNGEFNFDIPVDKQRVSITLHDKNNKFVDTTKVLTVKGDVSVYQQIYVQRAASPVTFNASESSTIYLGNGTLPKMEIDIPPYSFRAENGSVYEGNISTSVTFVDPSDPMAPDIVQSDLRTRDVEGSLRSLRTYGMFSMNFESDSGEKLQADGKMDIYIDAKQANINVEGKDAEENLPKIWRLNPTSGEWEFAGDLKIQETKRRKRANYEYFIVGEIEISILPQFSSRLPWINIDIEENRNRVCYSKVRVYNDIDTLNALSGISVTAVTYDSNDVNGVTAFGFQDTEYSDANGTACLQVFCNSRESELQFLTGIRAKKGDEVLTPIHSGTFPSEAHPNTWPEYIFSTYEHPNTTGDAGFVTFQSIVPGSNNNGPLYWKGTDMWEAASMCESANIDENHLIFIDDPLDNTNEDYDTDPNSSNDMEAPRTPCSWYPYVDDNKRECFVKILVQGPSGARFRVTSDSSSQTYCDSYGFRIRSSAEFQIETHDGFSAACIEFKCSGHVREYNSVIGEDQYIGMDETHIKITPVENSWSCRVDDINNNLRKFVNNSNIVDGISVVHVRVPTTTLSTTHGLYEAHCQDCDTSAYDKCHAGQDNPPPNAVDDPSSGWAIKYTCD